MSHQIDLSSEQIRNLVDYNPETGILTWLPTGNVRRAGKRAGGYTKPGTGYEIVAFARRHYYVHQVAWLHFYGTLPPKGMHIDHINGNVTDNRIANLRIATVAQNVQNQKRHRDNTSGYKGVCFHKPSKKWMAGINVRNTAHHLGLFDTPQEAHAAYVEASKRLHGEFSNAG